MSKRGMDPVVRPNRGRGFLGACAVLATASIAFSAHADSVAQVATAKRISRQTVTLIDPQGRPVPDAGVAGNTIAKVGDIVTFTIQFTPVANGAYRGMGGYITDYVPSNTEVVGARIVDRNGNTVSPHRGGLSCDGFGPRGSGWNANPLVNGSMSQLYADTGIFFSRNARTARNSHNPVTNTDEAFLSLKNGLPMPASPSGVGQFDQLLNTSAPYYAHNAWDLAQVAKFGPGDGNGPEHVGSLGIGYGSPVAGPESWYGLEVTIDPPGAPIIAANGKFMGNVGPWERVRATGGEIGRRGQGASPTPTLAQNTGYLQCPGNAPTRIGIPAVEAGGLPSGWDLSTSSPLPAGTNAVRFALGELVVGDEYFAEISLRIKALPLDATFGDVNCAEVVGGDASARAQNGGTGGKDYVWRYFLPAPACVSLNLLFENTVDKVLALANAPLTNSIEVKNLSLSTQTGVVVKDCYVTGDETFVPAGTTAGYTIDTTGTGCPNPSVQDAIVWNVGSLAPGESRVYAVKFTGKSSTSNQAVYTSAALPTPGFVATAYTTIGSLVVMHLALDAAPSYVAALPGTVHYTASLANVGTGAGTTMNYDVTLPGATWTYKAGTTKINGVASAQNPTQNGAIVHFAAPPAPTSIAAGANLTIEFDVDVPLGTAAGQYYSGLTSWVISGQDLEDSISGVAPVAVLTPRSDTPIVNAPILDGATAVTGTSTEAAGSIVNVYVNGNFAGTATVTGAGTYSVTVPPLFAGERVTATVKAAGELQSFPSGATPVTGISGVSACSDGIDNDGDGKIDFPADPGCASASDADETDVVECSDGIDNDGDGKTDFPADEGCSSYLDNTELGPPACSDGVDNDGDGKIDSPADPGCTSATDVNESDIAACADGIDNDGDGKVDFPLDPGCSSSLDDTENDSPGAPDASAPGGDAGAADATLIGSNVVVQGDLPIPNPGGVPDDGSSAPGADGSCACTVTGGRASPGEFIGGLMIACAFVVRRRLRRKRPRRAP